MSEIKHWLFKSEPNNYSFTDLLGEQHQTAEWDGVRNYQARNLMRDQMHVGDKEINKFQKRYQLLYLKVWMTVQELD